MAAALAAVALIVAACGGDDDEAGGGEALSELGEGEGQVNLIAWAGYVEDGSTDPAVDWVTPFEEETGCEVNVRLGNSSDEMVQLMQSGEYDGVSASGDATLRLIAGDEVDPVNVDLIPNYADVFEDLKLQPHNSVDGVPYGVPHGRGANLLVYNTEAFADAAPDSWGVMFEGGTAADGAVSVYDSPIYIADAALYLMATQPDLGITNPYALDQEQFDAAIALLEAQQPLVGQFWSLYTDQQAALEGGTVLAGTTWQVIVNLAQGNDAAIDAVKPVEGATGWSDTWMISSQAANPNCMYMWMDWIISPEANAQVAEWFGEAPSNAESCALTSDESHCETFHAEDAAYWEDVYYWTTATEECLDGRTDVSCVPYTEWVDAWNELRS
jgi:putative spermidine/putrescine transport system substrate-binding protein